MEEDVKHGIMVSVTCPFVTQSFGPPRSDNNRLFRPVARGERSRNPSSCGWTAVKFLPPGFAFNFRHELSSSPAACWLGKLFRQLHPDMMKLTPKSLGKGGGKGVNGIGVNSGTDMVPTITRTGFQKDMEKEEKTLSAIKMMKRSRPLLVARLVPVRK